MKNAFAFSLALSALATSAAFANPQPAAHVAPAIHAQVKTEQAVNVALAAPDKAASGFKQALDSGVLVAENRHEFGSQYQRY